MSDRKYRQRGYQDEPRAERQQKREPAPPEMRAPSVPGFKRIARCRRCGQPGPIEVAADTRCARCGYFAPQVTVERETGTPGTSSARQAFDDLFK